METQQKSNPTSVGELLSQLRQQLTTQARFRLPVTKDQARNLLLHMLKLEVESRGKQFILTENLYAMTAGLAEWLTDNSHYFGFILSGLCGNGKTSVVKALRRVVNYLKLGDEYGQWEFRVLDAKTICERYISDPQGFHELCYTKMLAIDDLGCEPVEIQSYGNIHTPIIDLLTRRYDRQLFTVITTNLNPKDIRPRYGDRIADRLNEMVRHIVFTNPTFRTP